MAAPYELLSWGLEAKGSIDFVDNSWLSLTSFKIN